MNKFLIVLVTVILAENAGFAQQKLEMTALNRITLIRYDTTYQFFVKKAPAKFKILADRDYHWFSPDTILITRGSFGGKLLNGSYRVFFPNKNLKEAGFYQNGFRKGLWNSWYPDGVLQIKTNWKKGKREGVFEEYDPGGKITRRGTYRNDLLSGEIIEYQDTLARKTIYVNGQVVKDK